MFSSLKVDTKILKGSIKTIGFPLIEFLLINVELKYTQRHSHVISNGAAKLSSKGVKICWGGGGGGSAGGMLPRNFF